MDSEKTRVVLRRWNQETGSFESIGVSNHDALASVEQWLDRNAEAMPPPEQIGTVMPDRELLITRGRDLDSAETRTIDIYSVLDSTGETCVPTDQIAALDAIFLEWNTTQPPEIAHQGSEG